MQPEKFIETREWFNRAQEDIAAGKCLLERKPPLVRAALFHIQQAVEKTLKGFLIWNECSFRKVHDLRELSGQVLKIEPTLEPSLKEAVLLDPFAVLFAILEIQVSHPWRSKFLGYELKRMVVPGILTV